MTTDAITVNIALSGDSWTITAQVTTPSVLPAAIFIYENTGTTILGDYVGVCSFDELQRLQVWNSQALPVFGNKFVRSTQAKITVPISVDPSTVTTNLINTAKTLKAEMLANATSSRVYQI